MKQSAEPADGEGDLVVRHDGAVGVLRLNRPKAINAITLEMVREIGAALDRFEADHSVGLVLLEGAGDRGLCAGGDIRGLYDSARAGGNLGKMFWREEYSVNARIEAYSKSYVAFMDGIVMGGGVGLACHGSHRVVTDKTRIGMPEVSLGFFPDVGGTWLLSRAPGEVGTYLALTGQIANGADALYAGLADALVRSENWPALREALTQAPRNVTHADVTVIIERFASPVPDGLVATNRHLIDQLFGYDTIEEIIAALDGDGSDFARAALNAIREKSPSGLKVTLRLLREARKLTSLKECLVREYRAALHVFASHDFVEGIRAAIVDKDRDPKWIPPRVEDVTPQIVEAYFTTRDGDELVFSN